MSSPEEAIVLSNMDSANHPARSGRARGDLDGTTKEGRDAERGQSTIPRIPLNPYDHVFAIALRFSILAICSCFLPVGMFFILKYAAHAKGSVVIGVSSAIFGAVSLPSLIHRTYSLTKPHSTTRPLGTARWQMDYFNWNFALGFVYVTALIIASTVALPAITRLAAMPLSLLLLQVCLQMWVARILSMTNTGYPFRFSSMPKGSTVRPAVYSLIEDVVAVDAGQGTEFREVFNQRYLASAPIRRLLREMDLLWGVSGVAVAVVVVVLIWELNSVNAAWVVGWTVPWVWTAICALITIVRTKAALRNEESHMG